MPVYVGYREDNRSVSGEVPEGEPHREVHVASLMIRCPNTGQPISTGIETDEYSLNQIADVPTRTRCPFCGLDHTWWKREAWLADQPGQPLLQSSEGRKLDKTA
jgi:hypothetical protein